MTPFGIRLRQLRAARAIKLKDMADALGVSAAYLSALEHGRRGRPTHAMVVAICAQLNIIWDEADELMRLARLSHPRITVDTAGLSAEATELANLLAERIRKLAPERVEKLLDLLKTAPMNPPRPVSRRPSKSHKISVKRPAVK
ncbi:MAG TPA: helix-turn-helix domain-containing protein [Stellaceae bacterium]|jgi:transcriptional regulator with XRE-family HTH domain|nr:helix-turn-helix domain-containing protein [Stellaceae bacterium]